MGSTMLAVPSLQDQAAMIDDTTQPDTPPPPGSIMEMLAGISGDTPSPDYVPGSVMEALSEIVPLGREAQKQQYAENIGEMFSGDGPIDWAVRNIAAPATQGMASVASAAVRPVSPSIANAINRTSQAVSAGLAMSDDNSLTGEIVRGVSQSIGQAALLAPYGLPGMAGGFGLARANEAYTEGRDSGLSPIQASGYAAIQGGIETGLTLAIPKGLEKVFPSLGGAAQGLEAVAQDLTGIAAQGFKGASKELAKRGVAELPEEGAIAVGQAITDYFAGVNADRYIAEDGAPDYAKMGGDLAKLVAQTLLTVGAVSSPMVATGAMRSLANDRDTQAALRSRTQPRPDGPAMADTGMLELSGQPRTEEPVRTGDEVDPMETFAPEQVQETAPEPQQGPQDAPGDAQAEPEGESLTEEADSAPAEAEFDADTLALLRNAPSPSRTAFAKVLGTEAVKEKGPFANADARKAAWEQAQATKPETDAVPEMIGEYSVTAQEDVDGKTFYELDGPEDAATFDTIEEARVWVEGKKGDTQAEPDDTLRATEGEQTPAPEEVVGQALQRVRIPAKAKKVSVDRFTEVEQQALDKMGVAMVENESTGRWTYNVADLEAARGRVERSGLWRPDGDMGSPVQANINEAHSRLWDRLEGIPDDTLRSLSSIKDDAAFVAAVEDASDTGLSSLGVADVRETLAQEQAMRSVRSKLEALSTGDISALARQRGQGFVNAAKAHGMPTDMLSENDIRPIVADALRNLPDTKWQPLSSIEKNERLVADLEGRLSDQNLPPLDDWAPVFDMLAEAGATARLSPVDGTYEFRIKDALKAIRPKLEEMGSPDDFGAPARIMGSMRERQQEATPGVKPIDAPRVMRAVKGVMKAVNAEVPIRTGHYPFRRKNYNAVYRSREKVIRLARALDVDSAVHEVGHAIETALFGEARPWTAGRIGETAKGELYAMGKMLYGDVKPTAGYTSEGWSEYLYYRVTQPEKASALAPRFEKWFEENVLAKNPRLRKAVKKAQESAVRLDKQGAVSRVQKSIVNQGSKRYKAARVLETSRTQGGMWKKFIRAMYEDGAPLLDVKADTVYEMRTALARTAPSAAVKWVEMGVADPFDASKTISRPLTDIYRTQKGMSEAEFGAYLKAHRAIELLGRNIGPGISKQDAQTTIREMEAKFPNIREAAEIYWEWNDAVLSYLAASSPGNAALVKKIRAKNKRWASMERELDVDDAGFSARKGGDGSALRRIKDSGLRTKDPTQSAIALATNLTEQANRTRVLEAAIQFGLGEKIEPPKDLVGAMSGADALKAIAKELNITDTEKLEGISEELTSILNDDEARAALMATVLPVYSNRKRPGKSDRFIIPRTTAEGVVEWYAFDPQMYDVFAGMSSPEVGTIMGAIEAAAAGDFTRASIQAVQGTARGAASSLRQGATGLNPAFTYMFGAAMDLQSYVRNTKGDGAQAFKNLALAIKELGAAAVGRPKSEWQALNTFLLNGGEMTMRQGQDMGPTRRAARRAVSGKKVTDILGDTFDKYRDLMQAPEMLFRIAEMRNDLERNGWKDGDPITQEMFYSAMKSAREVTVNFTAGGNSLKFWNQFVPFMNVAVQGPRAAAIAAHRNPARFAFMVAATNTIPAIAHWALFHDEEWYKELSPEEKMRYIFVPVGDNILRIPLDREVGGPIWGLTQAALIAWEEKDPQGIKDFFKGAIANFAPPNTPTAALVPFELASNKNLFRDRPIVPLNLEKRRRSQQHDDYTSFAARAIGNATGAISDMMERMTGTGRGQFDISPMKVDHAIRGFGGGVGVTLADLPDKTAGMTKDETEYAEYLLVGRAFQRGGRYGFRGRTIDELYKRYKESVTTQYDIENPENFLDKNRRLILQDATNAVSDIMTVRKFAKTREKKDDLMAAARAIAKNAMEAVDGMPLDATVDAFNSQAYMWRKTEELYKTVKVK